MEVKEEKFTTAAVIDNYYGCSLKHSLLFPSVSITLPDSETFLWFGYLTLGRRFSHCNWHAAGRCIDSTSIGAAAILHYHHLLSSFSWYASNLQESMRFVGIPSASFYCLRQFYALLDGVLPLLPRALIPCRRIQRTRPTTHTDPFGNRLFHYRRISACCSFRRTWHRRHCCYCRSHRCCL